MKQLVIFLILLTLILLTLLWVGSSELYKERELQRKGIEHLREQLKNCKQ